MPLLSEAKKCYVGTAPITRIYAGTQLVWGALQLRMVKCVVHQPDGAIWTRLSAEFYDQEDCVDCAELQSTYEYRLQAPGGGSWTVWYKFIGWLTDEELPVAYLDLGPASNNWRNDYIFELRINGVVGEQVLIDLASLPDVGKINPNFYCT